MDRRAETCRKAMLPDRHRPGPDRRGGSSTALKREGERVRLRAENGEHEDIVVPAGEVALQGRVAAIVRTV